MVDPEQHRHLMIKGLGPEEVAHEVAAQGFYITEVIYVVFKLFEISLSDAKSIGENAWKDIHGYAVLSFPQGNE